jgi:hypothetical protein
MQTVNKFIKKYGIKMESEQIRSRPDGLMSGRSQRHYNCTLILKDGQEMSLYFSQGEGIPHYLKIEDVIDCIASDCSVFEECEDALDLYRDFGYKDAKEARLVWDAITKQYEEALNFFGKDVLDELMYETERE